MTEKSVDRHGLTDNDYHLVPWHEVARYLTEKGVNSTCPACGDHKGNVNTEIDGIHAACYSNTAIRAGKDKRLWPMNEGNLFFVTECGNCGLMRNFDYGPMVTWFENSKRVQNT